MNPILRQMLLEPEGIVRRGLVGSYKFDDGQGQILTDSSGYGNHGQLGSTTAVDTNDPTWTGGGLSFTTDDYVKLPYMINAEADFTVYLVANVGAVAPSGEEELFGLGNSAIVTPYVSLRRLTTGGMSAIMRNDAGSVITPTINIPNPGIRLFAVKRMGGLFFFKDVINGVLSNFSTAVSSPITLNQAALGCLLRTTAAGFLNQPEYYASFYTRATTDAEDIRNLKAITKLLAKRGVILG